MALNQRPVITDIDVKYKDYAIGGKMITAHVQVTETHMKDFRHSNQARETMRKMLVEQLVDHMLSNNLVEIVTIKEPWSPENFEEKHRISARCYLAKDSDIKLLRTYG